MYGFLAEGVGQFSFPIRPAVQPGEPFIRSVNDVLREKTVRVRVFSVQANRFVDERAVFDETVLVSRLNAAVTWLSAQPGQQRLPTPAISGVVNLNVSSHLVNAVVTILRTGVVPGYEIWPGLPIDFLRTRRAQVRSRGGAMTLLGLAATGVGYALGGLPGAAVGAAAAFLKGKFDETRVG